MNCSMWIRKCIGISVYVYVYIIDLQISLCIGTSSAAVTPHQLGRNFRPRSFVSWISWWVIEGRLTYAMFDVWVVEGTTFHKAPDARYGKLTTIFMDKINEETAKQQKEHSPSSFSLLQTCVARVLNIHMSVRPVLDLVCVIFSSHRVVLLFVLIFFFTLVTTTSIINISLLSFFLSFPIIFNLARDTYAYNQHSFQSSSLCRWFTFTPHLPL